MRSRLGFLFRLLLCFAAFYALRDWFALGYQSLLETLSQLALPADVHPLDCGESCSLRLIAYLSLVVCTAEAGVWQRGAVLLVGLAVFAGIDLAGLYLWPAPPPFALSGGETFFQVLYGFVWNLLQELLLPLLLWMVAFDRHLGLFFPASEMGAALDEKRTLSES